MDNRNEGLIGNVHVRVPERHIQMLAALNMALEAFIFHNKKSLDDIMTDGIRPVSDIMGLDRVCVYRYKNTSEGRRLGMTYLWDKLQGGTAPIDERVGILPDIPVIRRWLAILFKGGFINSRVSDMSEDEAAFLSSFGVKAIYIAPIFTQGSFWGAVTLQDHTSVEYFPDGSIEAEMLLTAARSFARTFIQVETQREATEKNELIQVMFDASPIGLTTFDDNYNFIDCNKAVLGMYGVEKQDYLENFFKLSPKYQPDGSLSRDKAFEIMKRVITDGANIKIEWMHCTANGEPVPCDVTLTRIRQGERYIGLVYVYDLRNIKSLEQDIFSLKTEAEKIYYDPLTGIYNRRYLDKTLKQLVKSLSRSGSMLSLLMIDVDHFKKYNDANGHNEGDKCLKAVVEVLTQCITRETDFIARYGGEEFTVVLPNTGEIGACRIAQKMLEIIRSSNIPYDKNCAEKCVTISIGVTSGKVEHTYSDEDYIKCADVLLYLSKQRGRDRYTFGALENLLG